MIAHLCQGRVDPVDEAWQCSAAIVLPREHLISQGPELSKESPSGALGDSGPGVENLEIGFATGTWGWTALTNQQPVTAVSYRS